MENERVKREKGGEREIERKRMREGGEREIQRERDIDIKKEIERKRW